MYICLPSEPGGFGGFDGPGSYFTSNVFLILLLGMVVGMVFFCGLYVGSTFIQEHNNLDFKSGLHIITEGSKGLRGNGLPNPVAVLEEMWDHQVLRRTPPQANHPGLRGADSPHLDDEVPGAAPPPRKGSVADDDNDGAGTIVKPLKSEKKVDETRAQEKPVPPKPLVHDEEEEEKPQPPAKAAEKKRPSQEKEVVDPEYPVPGPGVEVKGFDTKGGSRFVKLKTPMDELSVTVAGWVYLDRKTATGTMNVIFSNRASGCEPKVERMGYTLYVNTWDTTDRQLILEWGNKQNGCAKLGSGQSGGVIEYDVWTHVAAVLTAESASIFINGKQVRRRRVVVGQLSFVFPLTDGWFMCLWLLVCRWPHRSPSRGNSSVRPVCILAGILMVNTTSMAAYMAYLSSVKP